MVFFFRTVECLFEHGLGLVDLKLSLEVGDMRETAAVGAASGVGKSELFACDIIVDGSPADRVSALWGWLTWVFLSEHTSYLGQSRPSLPSWGPHRQSRSYQRSEEQFPWER